MTESFSVCVEDVCCGGRFPTSYWADWFPVEGLVRFGGDWSCIPEMPAETEPALKDVHRWVNVYMWTFICDEEYR